MTNAATNTGKELERWVAHAYRQIGAKVAHDIRLAGNQIDVYVELEIPDRGLHRIAVETKDHVRPVGVKIVNDFAQTVDLLRRERLINEGVIVSTSGFTKEARDAAQTHCIRLLEQADLEAIVTAISKSAASPGEPVSGVVKTPFKPLLEAPATNFIPSGSFWRGSDLEESDAHPNEMPRTEIFLPAYEIGRYPVTNAQYACFLADNPHYPIPYSAKEENRSYNWDPQARIYPEGRADHPVVLVNWGDATTYCRWLSHVTGKKYRLPTEEEWERSARGGLPQARRYPWGDEWNLGLCNTQERGGDGTTSVHKFENVNLSPFEVVDLAGNVWEWTSSWYERYPDSPHTSPHYGQLYRVVRGGSWRNSHREARISCRGRYRPDVQRPWLGFRTTLETSN